VQELRDKVILVELLTTTVVAVVVAQEPQVLQLLHILVVPMGKLAREVLGVNLQFQEQLLIMLVVVVELFIILIKAAAVLAQLAELVVGVGEVYIIIKFQEQDMA